MKKDYKNSTYSPLSLLGLWDLFLAPSQFFREGKLKSARLSLFLALIPYAMMVTKGNMVKKFILRFEHLPSHPAQTLYNSWTYTWIMLAVGGLIGAAIYWFVGIKYFDSRLKWCGVSQVDEKAVREISIYSSLVYSLPGLIILFYESLAFENLKTSISYPGFGWELLGFQFMWWSCHVQWVGVKTRFNISGYRPFVWFYALPFVIQFIYLHQKFYLRTLKDFIYQMVFYFEGIA